MPNKQKHSAVYADIKRAMALRGHKVTTDWVKATIKALDEPIEVFDALVVVLSEIGNDGKIPAYPQAAYRHDGWTGWADFLGTKEV